MQVHVLTPDPNRPHHQTGEIVWATVGNYLENRTARPKVRPVVILRASLSQHWIAGLTTQARTKLYAHPRAAVPMHRVCSLCDRSYLWSSRPSWLSRLDVRQHIGWIDAEILAVIERHMHLPWHVRADLRVATAAFPHSARTSLAASL